MDRRGIPSVTPDAAEKAMNSAVDLMRRDLEAEGITTKLLASRLRRDLDRKETKIIKVKGAIFDWAEYLEREAAKLRGEDFQAPAVEKPYRVLASSSDETIIAIDVDAIGTQVEAREDAQKLMGLYKERLELSGPGGGPLSYDDIPAEERELLLAVARDYERRLNEKNAKRGKAAGKKDRGTRQDRSRAVNGR
jgi:hypothetical protein